jgi:hypothetical protein
MAGEGKADTGVTLLLPAVSGSVTCSVMEHIHAHPIPRFSHSECVPGVQMLGLVEWVSHCSQEPLEPKSEVPCLLNTFHYDQYLL